MENVCYIELSSCDYGDYCIGNKLIKEDGNIEVDFDYGIIFHSKKELFTDVLKEAMENCKKLGLEIVGYLHEGQFIDIVEYALNANKYITENN